MHVKDQPSQDALAGKCAGRGRNDSEAHRVHGIRGMAIRLVAPLLLVFSLGACALPPAISIASYVGDGVLWLATGKTSTDHGLSIVTGQDCVTFRVFGGVEEVCQDETIIAQAADATTVPTLVLATDAPQTVTAPDLLTEITVAVKDELASIRAADTKADDVAEADIPVNPSEHVSAAAATSDDVDATLSENGETTFDAEMILPLLADGLRDSRPMELHSKTLAAFIQVSPPRLAVLEPESSRPASQRVIGRLLALAEPAPLLPKALPALSVASNHVAPSQKIQMVWAAPKTPAVAQP